MSVIAQSPAWGLFTHAATLVNLDRQRYVAPVSEALSSYWSQRLPKGAYNVLSWLLSRTAGVGLPAAVGTLRQLLKPFHAAYNVVVHPLDISINTLRSHLHLLRDKRLVKIHQMSAETGAEQNAPRAFEIDFTVVVNYPGVPTKLRDTVLLIEETVQKSFTFGVPPPNLEDIAPTCTRGIKYIYRYEVPSLPNQRLGKPNHTLPVLRPVGGCRGETSVSMGKEKKLKSISLATPKKPRPAIQRSDSVQDILAGMKRKVEVRAATTKTKSAAGATDKVTIQNYLNELMREFYPGLPRLVVTDKPLSVLRKRLASYGIADYRELFRFAISEWGSIAKRNRQAFTRKLISGAKGTPMPELPSFSDLAYRLPYFITIHTSGTYQPATDTTHSEEQRLRARVVALEAEVAGTRERLRRAVRPSTPTPTTPRVVRRTTSDDDSLPRWE